MDNQEEHRPLNHYLPINAEPSTPGVELTVKNAVNASSIPVNGTSLQYNNVAGDHNHAHQMMLQNAPFSAGPAPMFTAHFPPYTNNPYPQTIPHASSDTSTAVPPVFSFAPLHMLVPFSVAQAAPSAPFHTGVAITQPPGSQPQFAVQPQLWVHNAPPPLRMVGVPPLEAISTNSALPYTHSPHAQWPSDPAALSYMFAQQLPENVLSLLPPEALAHVHTLPNMYKHTSTTTRTQVKPQLPGSHAWVAVRSAADVSGPAVAATEIGKDCEDAVEAPPAGPPQATADIRTDAPDTIAANAHVVAGAITTTSPVMDGDVEAQAAQSPLGAAVIHGPLGQLAFCEGFPATPTAPATSASTEPANDTARYGLHLRGVSALPTRLHAQHGELMQVGAGTGTATGAAGVDGHRVRSACAAEVEDYMFAARAGHTALATSLLQEMPSLATLTAPAPTVAGADVVFLSSGLALQPDVVATKHSINVHALGVNRSPTPAPDPPVQPVGMLEGVMGPPLPHSRDTGADAVADAGANLNVAEAAEQDPSLTGPQPMRLPSDLGAAAVAHAAYVGPGSYSGYGGAQAPDAMAAFLRGVDLHAHMAAYRFPLESALDQPPQLPPPQTPAPASPFELVADEEDTPDEDIMRRADTPPATTASHRAPAGTAFAEKSARMHAFPRVIGTAPLHWAVDGGHTRVVQALLQRGADPNQVRPDLHSPLMVAVVNGHTACAALLLQYGADAGYRHPRSGVTAIQLAVSFNKPLVVQLLLSAADGVFGLHGPQDADNPVCNGHISPTHRRKRPTSARIHAASTPTARVLSSQEKLDRVSESGDVDGGAQEGEAGGTGVTQRERALGVESGVAEGTWEGQAEDHSTASGDPVALSADLRVRQETQQPCGEGESEGGRVREGARTKEQTVEVGAGVGFKDATSRHRKALGEDEAGVDEAGAKMALVRDMPAATAGMGRQATGENERLLLKPPLLLHLEHGVDAQQLSLHPRFNTKRELWRLGLPEEGEETEGAERAVGAEEGGEGKEAGEVGEGQDGEEAWILEVLPRQWVSAGLRDEQRGGGVRNHERRGGRKWAAELRVAGVRMAADGYLEASLPTLEDPCEAVVEAELAERRRAQARAATVMQRARERWRRRHERLRATLLRAADHGPLRWLALLVRTRSSRWQRCHWNTLTSARLRCHVRNDTLHRGDTVLRCTDACACASTGAEVCQVQRSGASGWGEGDGAEMKLSVETAQQCGLEAVARAVEKPIDEPGSGVAEELSHTHTPVPHAADTYTHAHAEAEVSAEAEAGLAAEVLAEAATWGAPSLCVQEEVLNGDHAYYTATRAVTDAVQATQPQVRAQPEASTTAAVDLEPNYRLCEACCAELGVDVNCAGYAHYFCFTDETVLRGAVQVIAHTHTNADGAAASTAPHAQPLYADASFTLVVPPVPSQDDFIDSDDEEVDPSWTRREDPARGRPPPMPAMGASSLQTRQRFERGIDDHANASLSPFGSRQRGTRKPNATARVLAPSPPPLIPTLSPPRCPVVSRLTSDTAELLELHADKYSPYAALVRFFRGTLPATTHPFALMGFADDAGTCVRCCTPIAASSNIGPARGVSSHKLAAAVEDLWECVAPWVERVRYKQSVAELMLPQLGMRPLVNGLLGLPDHRHIGLCDDFLCSELFAAFLEQMGWVEYHDRRSFLRTLRAQPDSLVFSALRYVTLLTAGERYGGYLDLEQYHALAADEPRRLFEVLHTPVAELLGAEVALATHAVLLPGQSVEEYLQQQQQQQRQAVTNTSGGEDKHGDVGSAFPWREQMSEAARAVASPPYLTPLPHGPARRPTFYPSNPPRSLRAMLLPARVAAAAATARMRRRRREWRRTQVRALRKARVRSKRVRICDDAQHIEPDDTRIDTSAAAASPHARPCTSKSALATPRVRAGGYMNEDIKGWSVAHASGAEEEVKAEEDVAGFHLHNKQARRYLRMRSGSRHGGAYGYGYDYGFINPVARAPCPLHSHTCGAADEAGTAVVPDTAGAPAALYMSIPLHSAAPVALPGPASTMAHADTPTKVSRAIAAAAASTPATNMQASVPAVAPALAETAALRSATTVPASLVPLPSQPTATFRSLTPGQAVRTARATRAAAARKGVVRAYRSEDAGRHVPMVDAIGKEAESRAGAASSSNGMNCDDAFADPPQSARASTTHGDEGKRTHAMAPYKARGAALERGAGGNEGSAVGVSEDDDNTTVAVPRDTVPEEVRKSIPVHEVGGEVEAEAECLVYSDVRKAEVGLDEDVEVEEVEVESGEFDQLSGEVHMHPDGYEYVYVHEVVRPTSDPHTHNTKRIRNDDDGDCEPSGGRSSVEDHCDGASVYSSGDEDEDIFGDGYEDEDDGGDEDQDGEEVDGAGEGEGEDVVVEADGGLREYVSYEAVDADGAHVYSDVIGGRGDADVLVTIDGNVVYTQRKAPPRPHKPRRRRKRENPVVPQLPPPEPKPKPESHEDAEAEVRAAVVTASQLPPRPADDLSGYWSILDQGCARYAAAVAEARVRAGHQRAHGEAINPCACVDPDAEPAQPAIATGEAATHYQGTGIDPTSTWSGCGAGSSPSNGGGCPGLPQLSDWVPRSSAWAVQSAHVLAFGTPDNIACADECTCDGAEATAEHGGSASSNSCSAANAAAVREAFRDAVVYSLEDNGGRDDAGMDTARATTVDTEEGADDQHSIGSALSVARRDTTVSTTTSASMASAAAAVPALSAKPFAPAPRLRRPRRAPYHARLRRYLQQHTRARRQTRAAAQWGVQADIVCVSASVGPHGPTPGVSRRFVPVAGLPDLDKARVLYQRYWNLFQCQRLLVLMETMHAQYAADRSLAACLARNDYGLSAADLATVCASEYPLVLHAMFGYHVRRTLQALLEPLIPRVPATHLTFGAARRKLVYVFCCGCIVEHPRVHPHQRARARHAYILPHHDHADSYSPQPHRTCPFHTRPTATADAANIHAASGEWVNAEGVSGCVDSAHAHDCEGAAAEVLAGHLGAQNEAQLSESARPRYQHHSTGDHSSDFPLPTVPSPSHSTDADHRVVLSSALPLQRPLWPEWPPAKASPPSTLSAEAARAEYFWWQCLQQAWSQQLQGAVAITGEPSLARGHIAQAWEQGCIPEDASRPRDDGSPSTLPTELSVGACTDDIIAPFTVTLPSTVWRDTIAAAYSSAFALINQSSGAQVATQLADGHEHPSLITPGDIQTKPALKLAVCLDGNGAAAVHSPHGGSPLSSRSDGQIEICDTRTDRAATQDAVGEAREDAQDELQLQLQYLHFSLLLTSLVQTSVAVKVNPEVALPTLNTGPEPTVGGVPSPARDTVSASPRAHPPDDTVTQWSVSEPSADHVHLQPPPPDVVELEQHVHQLTQCWCWLHARGLRLPAAPSQLCALQGYLEQQYLLQHSYTTHVTAVDSLERPSAPEPRHPPTPPVEDPLQLLCTAGAHDCSPHVPRTLKESLGQCPATTHPVRDALDAFEVLRTMDVRDIDTSGCRCSSLPCAASLLNDATEALNSFLVAADHAAAAVVAKKAEMQAAETYTATVAATEATSAAPVDAKGELATAVCDISLLPTAASRAELVVVIEDSASTSRSSHDLSANATFRAACRAPMSEVELATLQVDTSATAEELSSTSASCASLMAHSRLAMEEVPVYADDAEASASESSMEKTLRAPIEALDGPIVHDARSAGAPARMVHEEPNKVLRLAAELTSLQEELAAARSAAEHAEAKLMQIDPYDHACVPQALYLPLPLREEEVMVPLTTSDLIVELVLSYLIPPAALEELHGLHPHLSSTAVDALSAKTHELDGNNNVEPSESVFQKGALPHEPAGLTHGQWANGNVAIREDGEDARDGALWMGWGDQDMEDESQLHLDDGAANNEDQFAYAYEDASARNTFAPEDMEGDDADYQYSWGYEGAGDGDYEEDGYYINEEDVYEGDANTFVHDYNQSGEGDDADDLEFLDDTDSLFDNAHHTPEEEHAFRARPAHDQRLDLYSIQNAH